MPQIKAEEKNEQFYNLILELIETQKHICERLEKIESRLPTENKNSLEDWSGI